MNRRLIAMFLMISVILTGTTRAKVIYVDSQAESTSLDGLIGFWKMNDNAATKVVTDNGPYEFNGTAVRNTSEMTVAGKFESALRFNGTNDHIDCGTDSRLLPEAWTFLAWVKCEDTATPTLLSFGNYRLTVKLQNNSAGKPAIIMAGNNYRTFDPAAWTTLKDGQWHHVAFTLPGQALNSIQSAEMYLDGVPVAVSATVATGGQLTKTRMFLGNTDAAGTQRFKGAMDQVMLVNRVMTATEILAQYNNQSVNSGLSWSSPLKTIGEALMAAVAGDEIWVKEGTYPLTQPLVISKNLKVFGGFAGTETQPDQRDTESNVTTVDGNDDVFHCFQTSAEVTIDGFTITRGKATGTEPANGRGGGIYASAGLVTIANCTLTANRATRGGAIALAAGSGMHSIQDCRIVSNTADHGAGVYSEFTIEIKDSQISDNSAVGDGGGLYLANDAPIVKDSSIRNNTAANGAGVYLLNARAQFDNSTIAENHASIDGGGVFNFGPECESQFHKTILAANVADDRGGGLFISTIPSDPSHPDQTRNAPKLHNCILVVNQADRGGAVFYDQFVSGELFNCTIASNQATTTGGGLYVFPSFTLPKLLNSILWNNTSPSGPQISFTPSGGQGSYQANLEVYYSDVEGGWPNTGDSGYTGYNRGNINVNPGFVDLDGPDGDLATWMDNDYRLLAGSMVIDQGVSGHPPFIAPTTDFLGTSRPQGARYDIGAYEYLSGQGLEYEADFDLDYSYTAPVHTSTFTSSNQSCDVTWWLGLTRLGGPDWTVNSVTFESPHTLGNFFPIDPEIGSGTYTWNNQTITGETEFEGLQTETKKEVLVPFTVTRALEGNAIMGSGTMSTIVTLTPPAGLAGFVAQIIIVPAWTVDDAFSGNDYFGTVSHVSTQVTGNSDFEFTHLKNQSNLQQFQWEFNSYNSGQPIIITAQTQVNLDGDVPAAFLEPIIIVSGNRSADFDTENWYNGVLTIPDGGRVVIDSPSSFLALDDYLYWYKLVLPHFATQLDGNANGEGMTDLADMVILSTYWLQSCNADNGFCGGADFDFSGKVDLIDFAILSRFWMVP